MSETLQGNPDLPKITRRKFSGILAASGIVTVIGAGCDEDQNCGAGSCDSLPLLNVPPEFSAQIELTIDPIRKILSPASRDFTIKIQQSKDGAIGGKADTKDPSNYAINLFIPDISIDTLRITEEIATHEGAHIFNAANRGLPAQYIEKEMKKRIGENVLSYIGYLLITESSYSDNPSGHPDDNFNEQLASTVAVLRYHPQDFIENLKRLYYTDRQIMATTGLITMDALVTYASIPTVYEDLGIDPQLIAYLMQEGQAATAA